MDAIGWFVEAVTEAAAGVVVFCVAVIAVTVGVFQGMERAFRPRRNYR